MRLTVNGRVVELEVPAGRTLVELLREDLELTGTKEACGVGVCGACTVLVDGRMLASCITLAAQAQDREVLTIEGLGEPDQLSPLQRSFVDNGGLQCGICTPGQVMAAQALLDANPSPSTDEITDWMMGNLCRCTGYYQIVESIAAAAAAQGARG
jgi:carbon-monoxide dehydrogenase small subunit